MRTQLILLLALLMLVVAASALRKKSNRLMLKEQDPTEWVREDGSRCVRTYKRYEPDNPNGYSTGGYCIDRYGKRTPWAIA